MESTPEVVSQGETWSLNIEPVLPKSEVKENKTRLQNETTVNSLRRRGRERRRRWGPQSGARAAGGLARTPAPDIVILSPS